MHSVPDHFCLVKGKSFGLGLTDVDRRLGLVDLNQLGFPL
jgi:hypothetical protein